MHFDQRTQQALREAGLETDAIREASDRVAELVREDAAAIESFFGDGGTFHSDMETAHGPDGPTEHAVTGVDLYTHGGDLRGYLSFDSWGVPVEDGRVLSQDVVELTLGPTVHDRVRFARTVADL
ncbi:DUF7532 family protein [Halopenitus persicus]|uniref:Uncharacterized protein n=1 Tax=Halopenitus persicus TaxID=1048396 RepID=A0A1H3FGX7_9EURY|nr:hypothetical protein [Halopenitus persicus]QHS16614.1 hypothetical protein GWK26_05325 [haloarchaeon 3A1-DGR]SDX89404.1 hypothetical protein SAMN05216564_10217 [Halopenitus persicus]